MHAAAVLPYEVANVLERLVFDGDFGAEDVADTWADIDALQIVFHPFDRKRGGIAIAAITSHLRRRHAADSAYVGLAQHLGATVWTLDKPLARNSRDVGLPVELVGSSGRGASR